MSSLEHSPIETAVATKQWLKKLNLDRSYWLALPKQASKVATQGDRLASRIKLHRRKNEKRNICSDHIFNFLLFDNHFARILSLSGVRKTAQREVAFLP